MTKLQNLFLPTITTRTFLAIFSMVIGALILDITLHNVSDAIKVGTIWGMLAFVSIAAIYVAAQYFILQFIKQKTHDIRTKSRQFSNLAKIVTISQYILTCTIVVVVLQMLLYSEYYTFFIAWNSSFGYSLALLLTLILAIKFFSWYRWDRSHIVLSYGISCIIISISIMSSLVFFNTSLWDNPAKISSHQKTPFESEKIVQESSLEHQESGQESTLEHQESGQESTLEHQESGQESTLKHQESGHGPDIRKFDVSTNQGKIQLIFASFHVLAFLSLWISTVLLLRTHSQRLGKAKFWTVITIPLASYLSIFVIVTPYLQDLSDTGNTILTVLIDAIGYTAPAVISGILFGLPFWTIAKKLKINNRLRDYLILASCGLVLFQLSSSADVILTVYPPFGLTSVTFVGLSSYLLLVGIYSSAISVSADEKLRIIVRNTAQEDLELFDSISFAQRLEQIYNKVIMVSRDWSENTLERTGIQSSVTETEIKHYVEHVVAEVEQKRLSKKG